MSEETAMLQRDALQGTIKWCKVAFHRFMANHIWHQISKALKPSQVGACSRVPLCQFLKRDCRRQQAPACMLRNRYNPSIAAELTATDLKAYAEKLTSKKPLRF